MNARKWVGVVALMLWGCGGGVSQEDFDAYKSEIATWKASVQSSGKKVNDWSTHAHNNVIKWVVDNASKFCPQCDPPSQPPSPPPNGEW